MKSKSLVVMGAITLFAVLAAPVRRPAQEVQQETADVTSATTVDPNPVPLINQPLGAWRGQAGRDSRST